MATPKVRKERAMATQQILASLLRDQGVPFADSAGAGRPGRDILNWPDVAVEVKATAGTPTVSDLAQAERYANGDLPVLVYRPAGYGPERVLQWPVTMRLADFLALARRAGLLPDQVAPE